MEYNRDLIENMIKNKVSFDFIFTQPSCSYTEDLKEMLEEKKVEITYIPANKNIQIAKDFNLKQTPTMIRIKDGSYTYYEGDINIAKELDIL